MHILELEIEEWPVEQTEQISRTIEYHGFQWKLRLFKMEKFGEHRRLSLICDRPESNLWKCTVSAGFRDTDKTNDDQLCTYTSWDCREIVFNAKISDGAGTRLMVVLTTTDEHGNRWRRRPPPVNFYDKLDIIFVVGQEKKEVSVNKESISCAGGYIRTMIDIAEGNVIVVDFVEYDEFVNILNIIYGRPEARVDDENVHSILGLANRLGLQIVEDRVITYLLSPSTFIPIHQRLLMADQCKLPFLKNKLIRQYTAEQLKELCNAPEWEMLSPETTRAVMQKRCEM